MFNTTQDKPQKVLLSANGRVIGMWRLNFEQIFEKSILIHPEIFENNGRKLNLIFEVPEATSPKILGMSEDARILGVGLYELQLMQQQ